MRSLLVVGAVVFLLGRSCGMASTEPQEEPASPPRPTVQIKTVERVVYKDRVEEVEVPVLSAACRKALETAFALAKTQEEYADVTGDLPDIISDLKQGLAQGDFKVVNQAQIDYNDLKSASVSPAIKLADLTYRIDKELAQCKSES